MSAGGVMAEAEMLMPGTGYLQSIARMCLLIRRAVRVTIPGKVRVRSAVGSVRGFGLMPSGFLTAVSYSV